MGSAVSVIALKRPSEEVAFYADLGVRAVEEEAAALFIVAAALGVRAAAVLVIDGVPTSNGGWRVDLARAQKQLQNVFATTIDFAATLTR